MLDFTLTPEQIKLQQQARQFALDEVLPVAWYYDRKDEIPMPGKRFGDAKSAGMCIMGMRRRRNVPTVSFRNQRLRKLGKEKDRQNHH